jgi:hypothetical protein
MCLRGNALIAEYVSDPSNLQVRSVGVKRVERGSEDRQIRRPFHPGCSLSPPTISLLLCI